MTRTWLPGMKNFWKEWAVFYFFIFLIYEDPLRIRSSLRKCNKKCLPWRDEKKTFRGGGVESPHVWLVAGEGNPAPMYGWGNSPHACLGGGFPHLLKVQSGAEVALTLLPVCMYV